MKSTLIIVAICAHLLWSALAATATDPATANWPQWRGPLANGVSPAADPPVTWSTSSNVLWKVPIPGKGTATPIISDDLIFIQTAIPTGKKDPAPVEPAEAQTPPSNPPGGRAGGPLSVKSSEGYRFVLLALDRQTGKTRWEQVAREETPHEGHHPSTTVTRPIRRLPTANTYMPTSDRAASTVMTCRAI